MWWGGGQVKIDFQLSKSRCMRAHARVQVPTHARTHIHIRIHERQQEYAGPHSQSPTLIFSQTAHTHTHTLPCIQEEG